MVSIPAVIPSLSWLVCEFMTEALGEHVVFNFIIVVHLFGEGILVSAHAAHDPICELGDEEESCDVILTSEDEGKSRIACPYVTLFMMKCKVSNSKLPGS